MNEIRIDKSFNPQSHAAEANLYPRGVAEIRQRVASGGSFGSAAAGVKQLIGGAADLLGVITQAQLLERIINL